MTTVTGHAVPFSYRTQRHPGLEFLGAEYLGSIPTVWQVVPPLALDVTCDCSGSPTAWSPVRSPSHFTPRYYTVKALCKDDERSAHVFFLGLETADDEDDINGEGAEKIASLLNDQNVVQSLYGCKDHCDAPFSHGSIADHLDVSYFAKIDGLAFHCHCDDEFSTRCWRGAFSATDRAALLCRDLRKAKASVMHTASGKR